MNPNWQEHQPKVGSAIGGNYLCVHWRRRDFVYAHKKEVPSIQGTVDQVRTFYKI
jgi:peptide-O-fucosyltransferase